MELGVSTRLSISILGVAGNGRILALLPDSRDLSEPATYQCPLPVTSPPLPSDVPGALSRHGGGVPAIQHIYLPATIRDVNLLVGSGHCPTPSYGVPPPTISHPKLASFAVVVFGSVVIPLPTVIFLSLVIPL